MIRLAGTIGVCAILLLLAAAVAPGWAGLGASENAQAQTAQPVVQTSTTSQAEQGVATPQPVARPAQPPEVTEVLRSGVLIVISKASQRMFVFKDGEPWASSPVSTGKRGHATPAGVFPILQKQVFHRSNIYSNAPMPYMQRLTWSGIAIHAGHLPGYPASHGCIRLPYGFARSLYSLTRASATTVVVTNAAIRSDGYARTLALSTQTPRATDPGSPETVLAAADAQQPGEALAGEPVRPVLSGPQETIQLAAATSPGEAEAYWQQMVAIHPELGDFEKTVVSAVVGSRRYYRLRASAPGAHAYCLSLKRAGEDCFNVS